MRARMRRYSAEYPALSTLWNFARDMSQMSRTVAGLPDLETGASQTRKKGRFAPGDIGIGRLGDAFGNTWSAFFILIQKST